MNALLLTLLAPTLIEFERHEMMPAELRSKSLLASSSKSLKLAKGSAPRAKAIGADRKTTPRDLERALGNRIGSEFALKLPTRPTPPPTAGVQLRPDGS